NAGGGGGMEGLSSTDIFLFEGFRLDRRGLFRKDKDAATAPVEIGSRALDVFRVLLQRPVSSSRETRSWRPPGQERLSRITTSTSRFRRCVACSIKTPRRAAAF